MTTGHFSGGGGGGGGTGFGGIDWNGPVSNTALDAVAFPLFGQSDPLGLSSIFPPYTVAADTVGAHYNAVTNMTATQRNQLGDILSVSLGQAPKSDYSIRSVQDMLDTAFRQAGESGATNLSDYLSKKVTDAQQNGQAGADSIHVIAPGKVAQTTYTAADIQHTADQIGQQLLGRNLNAAEMQGVLNIMNTASATKAQAQGAADTAALQQQMSVQNAQANPGATTSASGVNTTTGNFATDLLTTLGLPTTAQNIAAINAWHQAEGGNASFNPLNTTQGASGASDYNSVGVKNYTSYQQGVQATAQTLTNGHYANILNALKAGNDAQAVASAVGASPWGTSGSLMSKVLAQGGATIGTAPSGSKSGTTDVYQSPVISQIPADPSAAEAATNFIETQRSPDYQKNNLLNVFEMIESNLKSPVPNQKVMSSPVVMK